MDMLPAMRFLCLGNELLADDAFGFVAAGELRRRFPQLDVVFTPASGLSLMDYLPGIQVLIVVDTIQTGKVAPGTLYILRTSDFKSAFGPSQHYIGLLETLQLAKELLFNIPNEVIILAVEAADCLTLGGQMHEAVKLAVGIVADLAGEIAARLQSASAPPVEDSGDGLVQAIRTVSALWGAERLVVL